MPDYESEFITLSPERKRTVYDDCIQGRVQKRIKDFHGEVENALDEYLMFKYNISSEQIKKVIANTNNFKLKHNFQKIVQGDFESWYDNGELFMTTDRANLTVHKRWREDGKL